MIISPTQMVKMVSMWCRKAPKIHLRISFYVRERHLVYSHGLTLDSYPVF